VEQAISALRRTAPTGGTSLQNAFAVVAQLSPAPDNVILVTDGLPTQGDKPPLMRTLVTAEQREDLMQASVVLATFVWQAASRDAKLPRKPMPPGPAAPARAAP